MATKNYPQHACQAAIKGKLSVVIVQALNIPCKHISHTASNGISKVKNTLRLGQNKQKYKLFHGNMVTQHKLATAMLTQFSKYKNSRLNFKK